jgi:hypothetical protein
MVDVHHVRLPVDLLGDLVHVALGRGANWSAPGAGPRCVMLPLLLDRDRARIVTGARRLRPPGTTGAPRWSRTVADDALPGPSRAISDTL